MQKNKQEVDIILDILMLVLKHQPDSVFVNSLHQQYCVRGGLSKKQLEGLHSKASKFRDIAPGKMVTLEAIIKRKPTRYKSEISLPIEPVKKEDNGLELISAILQKAPQHKRVLFLKAKFEQGNLATEDVAELEKFHKLLCK